MVNPVHSVVASTPFLSLAGNHGITPASDKDADLQALKFSSRFHEEWMGRLTKRIAEIAGFIAVVEENNRAYLNPNLADRGQWRQIAVSENEKNEKYTVEHLNLITRLEAHIDALRQKCLTSQFELYLLKHSLEGNTTYWNSCGLSWSNSFFVPSIKLGHCYGGAYRLGELQQKINEWKRVLEVTQEKGRRSPTPLPLQPLDPHMLQVALNIDCLKEQVLVVNYALTDLCGSETDATPLAYFTYMEQQTKLDQIIEGFKKLHRPSSTTPPPEGGEVMRHGGISPQEGVSSGKQLGVVERAILKRKEEIDALLEERRSAYHLIGLSPVCTPQIAPSFPLESKKFLDSVVALKEKVALTSLWTDVMLTASQREEIEEAEKTLEDLKKWHVSLQNTYKAYEATKKAEAETYSRYANELSTNMRTLLEKMRRLRDLFNTRGKVPREGGQAAAAAPPHPQTPLVALRGFLSEAQRSANASQTAQPTGITVRDLLAAITGSQTAGSHHIVNKQ